MNAAFQGLRAFSPASDNLSVTSAVIPVIANLYCFVRQREEEGKKKKKREVEFRYRFFH